MDNPRPEKVAVVEEVKRRISDSDATILTEYRGLTVKDLASLRGTLRAHGGEYKIYKNTLVRFAVRDLDLAELESSLTGPTAVTFVKGDAAAVAKALRDFAKTNPNLVVKGGVLGTKTLTAEDAVALAELPSREVLLSQFAGLLAQPMQQFAGLLQALPRNFAYGLKALVEKNGGLVEAPSASDPEITEPETSDAEAPAEATAEAPVAEPPAAEAPVAEISAAVPAEETTSPETTNESESN